MLEIIWQNVHDLLSGTPIFPYLWIPHCVVMCQAVKATLGDKKQHVSVSNPLSLYLMSVIYTYPGGILSQMMLGEPPFVFLSNTNQLMSFSLVWYIMFYTRISLLFNIRIIMLVCVLAQDLMRLNLVLQAVKAILTVHPSSIIYPAVFANVKSSGFMIVKYTEHVLVNGLSKPFSIPHHSAKTMFISSLVFIAQVQGIISMPISSLLTITAITTMIFRLLSSDLSPIKITDPYNKIELTFCSLIFGKQKIDENRNVKEKKQDVDENKNTKQKKKD